MAKEEVALWTTPLWNRDSPCGKSLVCEVCRGRAQNSTSNPPTAWCIITPPAVYTALPAAIAARGARPGFCTLPEKSTYQVVDGEKSDTHCIAHQFHRPKPVRYPPPMRAGAVQERFKPPARAACPLRRAGAGHGLPIRHHRPPAAGHKRATPRARQSTQNRPCRGMDGNALCRPGADHRAVGGKMRHERCVFPPTLQNRIWRHAAARLAHPAAAPREGTPGGGRLHGCASRGKRRLRGCQRVLPRLSRATTPRRKSSFR